MSLQDIVVARHHFAVSYVKHLHARLGIVLGNDVSGQAISGDLTRMPHLLIAGATGSGKSVCINSLITSLLVTRTPDEVQFVMIDPNAADQDFWWFPYAADEAFRGD